MPTRATKYSLVPFWLLLSSNQSNQTQPCSLLAPPVVLTIEGYKRLNLKFNIFIRTQTYNQLPNFVEGGMANTKGSWKGKKINNGIKQDHMRSVSVNIFLLLFAISPSTLSTLIIKSNSPNTLIVGLLVEFRHLVLQF